MQTESLSPDYLNLGASMSAWSGSSALTNQDNVRPMQLVNDGQVNIPAITVTTEEENLVLNSPAVNSGQQISQGPSWGPTWQLL